MQPREPNKEAEDQTLIFGAHSLFMEYVIWHTKGLWPLNILDLDNMAVAGI